MNTVMSKYQKPSNTPAENVYNQLPGAPSA